MAFEDSGRHLQWPKVADAVIEANSSMELLSQHYLFSTTRHRQQEQDTPMHTPPQCLIHFEADLRGSDRHREHGHNRRESHKAPSLAVPSAVPEHVPPVRFFRLTTHLPASTTGQLPTNFLPQSGLTRPAHRLA
jgi:hypothetical protein